MVKESAQQNGEKSLKTQQEAGSVAENAQNDQGQEQEVEMMPEEESPAVEEETEDSEKLEIEKDDSEDSDIASEEDVIESLKKEVAEKEDKFLRLQAELENFKRRNAQEMKTRFKFAGQALALSILPGLDNLERALEQAKDEESEQMKEFITGIEMVRQQFYEAFKQHHIERVFPLNEPFNPNVHEAMGVIETDEVEPDHISQVFQAGYMYHDRVIRPAVVQVAKKK
jgi:molecular chaperone GrpE